MSQPKYSEALPENCPPNFATETALVNVCRFLPFPVGDARNFHSHAKLGKKTGNAGDCRAASVSLFTAAVVPDILSAKKTSFFKKFGVCLIDIPENSGKCTLSKSGHIDWWMYFGFNPNSAVTQNYQSGDEFVEDWIDG